MPTYEYKREDGSIFEVTQKMSETPLKTCPTTGQTVKRIISGGGGVLYKGDGWYVTDYKNGGKKAEEKEPSAKKEEPKAEKPKAESSSKENKPAE
ncbi:MAG: FmdB family zinc ribbon protein [Balneolaceae bacterium]